LYSVYQEHLQRCRWDEVVGALLVLDASALSVYTQVYVHSQVGATASDLELVVDAMSRVATASTFAKLCQTIAAVCYIERFVGAC